MAEYYPLLAKAVSALDMDATEARHAIYDRARTALRGQLRSVAPPLADTHIESEARALDLAIARIEAEIAIRSAIRGGAARGPLAPASPPAAGGFMPAASHPPASGGFIPAARPLAPPVLRPPPPRPPAAPLIAPRPPAPPAAIAAPTISRIAEAEADQPAASAAAPSGGQPPAPAAESRSGARAAAARPAAPVAPEKRPRNLRGLIVTLAIMLVVAAVGAAAWYLKQSQDELARIAQAAPPAEDTAPAPLSKPEKNADRVGGAPKALAPLVAPQPPAAPAGPATQTLVIPPPPGQTAPPGPAADSTISPVKVPTTTLRPSAQTAAANPIPTADQVAQGIPVAQRAAILVDAPDEPAKFKTYTGTAIWRFEQIKKDGKPPAAVLRAEIDIPSAKLQAAVTLQKNADASLPASHMMELRFTVAPGADFTGVKDINMPEMRREEVPAGEPLSGTPVPVVENFFIVGLAKGDAETSRNIDLLSSRNWVDIPLTLNVAGGSRRAKITFEKGAAGERALAEALAAWK